MPRGRTRTAERQSLLWSVVWSSLVVVLTSIFHVALAENEYIKKDSQQPTITPLETLWYASTLVRYSAIFGTFFLLGTIVAYLFYPALSAATHQVETMRETIQTTATSSDNTSFVGQQLSRCKPLLSVIIPAYNEQDRLAIMLQSAFEYLSSHQCPALRHLQEHFRIGSESFPNNIKNDYNNSQRHHIEWVLVNDGSTDETVPVYRSMVSQLLKNSRLTIDMTFVVITLPVNSGKGAAVQAGMLQSNGWYRLMVDADGATRFSCLQDLVVQGIKSHQYHQSTLLTWGSRAHLQEQQQRSKGAAGRTFLRQWLMHAFHWFVRILCCSTTIQDTQCGFKLFDQRSAQLLFRNLHLRRWAFDTELVVLAHVLQLPICEVFVDWKEVEGSKLHTSALNLAFVAIGMLRDMICVRLCYGLGIWRIQGTQDGISKKED